MVLDRDNDGLVHLVADHRADLRFSQIPFAHSLLLLPFTPRRAVLQFFLAHHGFDDGDFLPDGLQTHRVVELIDGMLEPED